MKSLDFSAHGRGFHGARIAMEKEADRLKVEEQATIISVCFVDEAWWLFYEPNVSFGVLREIKEGHG